MKKIEYKFIDAQMTIVRNQNLGIYLNLTRKENERIKGLVNVDKELNPSIVKIKNSITYIRNAISNIDLVKEK